jgi:hypothetical protein
MLRYVIWYSPIRVPGRLGYISILSSMKEPLFSTSSFVIASYPSKRGSRNCLRVLTRYYIGMASLGSIVMKNFKSAHGTTNSKIASLDITCLSRQSPAVQILGTPPALRKKGNIMQTLLLGEGPKNDGFKEFEFTPYSSLRKRRQRWGGIT